MPGMQGNRSLPGMGGVFYPVNLGLFGYAANNPMKYVDPDGRTPHTYKYSDGSYGFSSDNAVTNAVNSSYGAIPFIGGWVNESLWNMGGFESITKDDIYNAVQGRLSLAADTISQAEALKKLFPSLESRLSQVSKIGGRASAVVTGIDVIKQLVDTDDTTKNQLIAMLFNNDMNSKTREGVIVKYSTAFLAVEELIKNGQLSYQTDLLGNVKGYSYKQTEIDAIKNKLHELD
jgi:hypothetical protein